MPRKQISKQELRHDEAQGIREGSSEEGLSGLGLEEWMEQPHKQRQEQGVGWQVGELTEAFAETWEKGWVFGELPEAM